MNKTRVPRWLTVRLVVLELVLLTVPLILFTIDSHPVHAQGTCTGSKDYGDAPSSYGDACATPSATLRIGGTTPDSESGSQYSAGATGDGADECFLNPLTPIDLAYPQYVWTVPVSNTTGSSRTLAGWIDFNGNGTFEANERATAAVPNGATTATLTWNIPITATPNIATYVRLRISTDSNVGPTGSYGSPDIGEVEDYAVTTVQSIVCAPGTTFYFIDGTTADNATIRTFDVSTGVATTVNNPPSQGRINGIAVDQTRGFVYYQDASTDGTADGIYYWDAVAGTLTSGNGTVTNDAATAPLNLPLSNGWRTASGAFANGKYYAGIDGGDLGTIYEITFDAAGTAPVASRALFTPNAGCGQTYCNDYGDLIVIGNRMYVAYWSAGGSTQVQHLDVYDINSQRRISAWSSSYYYSGNNAWAYQLGRDGNGTVYAVRQNTGGVYAVDQASGVINEGTLIRSIGVTVFDASECPVVPMDFGDAPTSYGWDAGPRAARHGIVSDLYLGSSRTVTETRDLRGFSSTNADGDDTHTYNGGTATVDDENAVSNIPRMTVDSTTYVLTNVVVYNNTGRNATLYGWVDFNRDGTFATTERVNVTVPSSAATQSITLTWSGLSGLVYGQSYLRLRLSTSTVTTSTWGTSNDGAFLATGYAPNGEVEDYPVQIDNRPTAVTISTFSARNVPPNRSIEWIPLGLITGIVASGIGGLIIYRRDRLTRRRRNL